MFLKLNSAFRAADHDIALAFRHSDFLSAVGAPENPMGFAVCHARAHIAEPASGLRAEIKKLFIFRSSGADIPGIHPKNAVEQDNDSDQIHNVVRKQRNDHQNQRSPETNAAQIIGTIPAIHKLLHFLANPVHTLFSRKDFFFTFTTLSVNQNKCN
jgi:hypothetical protein